MCCSKKTLLSVVFWASEIRAGLVAVRMLEGRGLHVFSVRPFLGHSSSCPKATPRPYTRTPSINERTPPIIKRENRVKRVPSGELTLHHPADVPKQALARHRFHHQSRRCFRLHLRQPTRGQHVPLPIHRCPTALAFIYAVSRRGQLGTSFQRSRSHR